MEVRPADSPIIALEERYALAGSLHRIDTASENVLQRIANTARKVLDVPVACIYLRGTAAASQTICCGPGAEALEHFVASLAARASGSPIVVHGGEASGASGDGVAVQSYISVPIDPVTVPSGIFCVLDYRKNAFSEEDLRLVEDFAALIAGELARQREFQARVAMETELRASRDRAEEMNRLKSAFLANMSHEIRTPLTTILGFAEVLEEEVGRQEREFVRLIREGGKRLMNTLVSLLDLARLEASSFEICTERFDLVKRIRNVCERFEPLAIEQGIELSVHVPGYPVEAVLDPNALDRALGNLLGNAIKFTAQGAVTVSVEADELDVVIHVADTGVGISEEFMPYLFDEFKQESEGLSRIHEGAGLGLPIAKRLVELMKGKIMADSEKDQGSVFTMVLPRNGTEVRGAASEAGPDSRPRVLVVEDNADTRTLVNHLLRKSYEVVCVSSADEALTRAGEEHYDVLLVDINLGKGKSGEDLLHEIKSLPGYHATPIVAVTAYAMPGDRERFFAEGFDDYVSKPFSKQRLLESLEAVLQD